MDWDLGLGGLGYLLGMSLLAAVIAHVWAHGLVPRWFWAAATAAYAAVGALVSEVWFGWATEEELQPNIDGLSRDEVLLALVVCVVATYVGARELHRRHRPDRGTPHRA